MKRPPILNTKKIKQAFTNWPNGKPAAPTFDQWLCQIQRDADLKWFVEWLDAVLIYHNGIPHLPLSRLQELKKLAEGK